MSVGSPVSVPEGQTGDASFATVDVTLSAASGLDVSVDWATADDTATVADNDYVADAGQLDFAPGETSKTVLIEVVGDVASEGDETFDVVISSPVNATLGSDDGRRDDRRQRSDPAGIRGPHRDGSVEARGWGRHDDVDVLRGANRRDHDGGERRFRRQRRDRERPDGLHRHDRQPRLRCRPDRGHDRRDGARRRNPRAQRDPVPEPAEPVGRRGDLDRPGDGDHRQRRHEDERRRQGAGGQAPGGGPWPRVARACRQARGRSSVPEAVRRVGPSGLEACRACREDRCQR